MPVPAVVELEILTVEGQRRLGVRDAPLVRRLVRHGEQAPNAPRHGVLGQRRGVQLTEAGQDYSQQIGPRLDALEQDTLAVMSQHGTGSTLENHFLRVFRLAERDDTAQIATITGAMTAAARAAGGHD